jgi:hypothetical protein
VNALAALLLLIPSASASPAIDKSVALLYRQTDTGGMEMICTATAFERIAGKTMYLTAAHCVTEDEPSAIGKSRVVDAPLFLSTDDRDAKDYVRASVIEVGVKEKGYDYAVLSSALDLPRLLIGDERLERDYVRIRCVGAPAGVGKVMGFGHVALRHIDRPLKFDEQKINWAGAALVSVDDVEGGSSGSAIVSEDTGKIIGILVGTYKSMVIAVPASRVATQEKANILYRFSNTP